MNNQGEYFLKSGFTEIHFNEVTSMLQTVFWIPGIKKEEVIQGAKNSALVVGAFTADNTQIGYARAISDKTRFAYILDVIVHEYFRKQGIGQAKVNHILNHQDLKDVYQWLLITKDAHRVYQKAGFKPISRTTVWMEIRKPRTIK